MKRIVLAATDPGGPTYVEPFVFVKQILAGNVNSEVLFALSFPPTKSGIDGGAAYLEATLSQSDVLPDSLTVSTQAQIGQSTAAALWKESNGSVWYLLSSIPRGSVMVANGNLDLLVRPVNNNLVAKQISGTVHCVYPGTGHGFLFQEWKLFGETSLAFLELGVFPKGKTQVKCSRVF